MIKEIPQPSNQEKSVITGQELIESIPSVIQYFSKQEKSINTLNVFPVPDGDTGTNMLLTLKAGYQEIVNFLNHQDTTDNDRKHIGKLFKVFAHGTLMGARGNSGVILSQIFRGFSRSLEDKAVVSGKDFVVAVREAKATAYKGVQKPKEGTILTVITDIANTLEETPTTDDLYALLNKAIQAADKSVKNTPNLLPILKQSNVVDSGGQGLLCILEGLQRYINGDEVPIDHPLSPTTNPITVPENLNSDQHYRLSLRFTLTSDISFNQFCQTMNTLGSKATLQISPNIYQLDIYTSPDHRFSIVDYLINNGTVKTVTMENLQTRD